MRKLPYGKLSKIEKAKIGFWQHSESGVTHGIRVEPFLEESGHSLSLMTKRYQPRATGWSQVEFCGCNGLYTHITMW